MLPEDKDIRDSIMCLFNSINFMVLILLSIILSLSRRHQVLNVPYTSPPIRNSYFYEKAASFKPLQACYTTTFEMNTTKKRYQPRIKSLSYPWPHKAHAIFERFERKRMLCCCVPTQPLQAIYSLTLPARFI
uniref:Uncharacterized protein n=1 Tax=Glossina austeni TaxID=7395 RepID=A0A1A9VEJ9_GLOAU